MKLLFGFIKSDVSQLHRIPNKYPPQVTEVKQEIERYMNVPLLPIDGDALFWWRDHAAMFPTLAKLARKYLAIPATSVPL